MAGPRLRLRLRPGGATVSREGGCGLQEVGRLSDPSPSHRQRSESEGTGSREPCQNRRFSLPFIKLLSVLGGGNRSFAREDTRFPAPNSQWKSEQEQINTITELFGTPLKASHPLPSCLGPPSPHFLTAAQQLISRRSGHSVSYAYDSSPPTQAPPGRRRHRARG